MTEYDDQHSTERGRTAGTASDETHTDDSGSPIDEDRAHTEEMAGTDSTSETEARSDAETRPETEVRATAGPPREPTRPALTSADREALTLPSDGRVGWRVAVPGLVFTTAGFVIALGPVGLLAGLLTGLLWAGAPPVYAATAGMGLAAAFEVGGPPAILTAVGLVLVLCAPLDHETLTDPWWTLGAVGVAGVLLGGVLALTLDTTSLLLAAGVLVSVVGLGLYTTHRVGLASIVYPSVESIRGQRAPADDQSTGGNR